MELLSFGDNKKDTYSKFFLKKTVGSNPTKAAFAFWRKWFTRLTENQIFFLLCLVFAGLAQLVRASALQAGGRRFEPVIPHHLLHIERNEIS